jgi:hypothetical protein
MMSMVYLSSLPLTQADFDAEEICPGLFVEVGCMVGVEWQKYVISRCLARETVPRIWYCMGFGVCVSKCCGCDLCSRLCRACDGRKRRLRPASAAELASPTFVLRRALIRRQPCLALSHCRLCCQHLSPFLPSYTPSYTTPSPTPTPPDPRPRTTPITRPLSAGASPFNPNPRLFIPSTAKSRPTHIL